MQFERMQGRRGRLSPKYKVFEWAEGLLLPASKLGHYRSPKLGVWRFITSINPRLQDTIARIGVIGGAIELLKECLQMSFS